MINEAMADFSKDEQIIYCAVPTDHLPEIKETIKLKMDGSIWIIDEEPGFPIPATTTVKFGMNITYSFLLLGMNHTLYFLEKGQTIESLIKKSKNQLQ